MQLYGYYVILIATSVKSQLSIIKSNNGTPEEIGLALGPASVSLKLTGTTDSEESIPPRKLPSTINSNELATNEITPNSPEIAILADDNQVPIKVEVEGFSEMTDISEITVPGKSTSAFAESGSSSIILSSEATESANIDIKSVVNNIEGTESTNIPSTLASSSTTGIFLPASNNLSTQATTTVPLVVTTMGGNSEVSAVSKTTLFSIRAESGYVMTVPTSTATEPSSSNLNTEVSPIGVQYVSSSKSYPTSVITSSAPKTKTTESSSLKTEATPTSIPSPSNSYPTSVSTPSASTPTSKTTESSFLKTEATPNSVQVVSPSNSYPTSVITPSAPTIKTTESSSLKPEATTTSVHFLLPNGSYTTSYPTSSIASSTSTIPPISTLPTARNDTTSPSSLCGENEVYSCLPLCPRTCNNPLSKVLCPPIPSYITFCRRGCTCITGYLFEKSIKKCLKACPATLPLNG